MSDFSFNGTSASSLQLCVERIPRIIEPKKRVRTYSVSGRNGNLTQWDGSYEDIVVRYECWFRPAPGGLNPIGYRTVQDLAKQITDWLMLAPHGSRLEDTYDPGFFRRATFVGPLDIENIFSRYGRVTIEFQCAPQRFLVDGDRRLSVTSTDWLLVSNPTRYPSKPLFEVTTNGNLGGVIRVDDYSLNLFFGQLTEPTTVYIDTELVEAWYVDANGQKISCNHVVSSPNFPQLDPGAHKITWSGLGIDSVAVIPRWWRL